MLPTVVLIGGTHAAGKTTLADALSGSLEWPLISRDRVRAGLAWTAQEVEQEPAGDLSRSGVRLFFETVLAAATAGMSCIAESTFRRGLSEADLLPLLDIADVRLLHCIVPRQTAIQRAAARDGREFVAAMLESRDEARWNRVEEPLDLPVPLLRINTADGWEPTLEEIVAFARGRGAV